MKINLDFSCQAFCLIVTFLNGCEQEPIVDSSKASEAAKGLKKSSLSEQGKKFSTISKNTLALQ